MPRSKPSSAPSTWPGTGSACRRRPGRIPLRRSRLGFARASGGRGLRAGGRAARSNSAEEFEAWFRKDVGRQVLPAEAPADLAGKIQDELSGKRRMRFDLRGLTPFEQAVLRKTRQIPRGEVRPYGWVAREIGHPAAVRAVGTALANNPIPYFIPCHRVVRTDGQIGNYGGGGPEAKRAILTMEGVRVNRLQELASKGVRYQGVKTTKVFCYPTCHTGRHALEKNVVWLHDEASARAAGFRPCKVCRPGAQLSA